VHRFDFDEAARRLHALLEAMPEASSPVKAEAGWLSQAESA
jgi:hypothetical protein